MAHLCDYGVYAETILYFCSVILGLVISIPLGVTTNNLGDECILYTSFEWKAQFTRLDFGSKDTCGFIVGLAVVMGIIVPLLVGVVFVYVLVRNRGDPQISRKMWVIPFLVISVLGAGTFLIAACMVSVGFKLFCDSYNDGDRHPRCSDFQNVNWRAVERDSTTTYDYLLATQAAAWMMVFVWAAQAGLGFARFFRNRRNPDTEGMGPATISGQNLPTVSQSVL